MDQYTLINDTTPVITFSLSCNFPQFQKINASRINGIIAYFLTISLSFFFLSFKTNDPIFSDISLARSRLNRNESSQKNVDLGNSSTFVFDFSGGDPETTVNDPSDASAPIEFFEYINSSITSRDRKGRIAIFATQRREDPSQRRDRRPFSMSTFVDRNILFPVFRKTR